MSAIDKAEVFLEILKDQARWASVCTEPGMVAFMASKVMSYVTEPVLSLEVHLSGGILKNALSAGLPNTTRKGPDVAAAAGSVARCPEKGLTILGELNEEQLAQALDLVDSGRVAVKWDAGKEGVYGKCILRTANHTAEVVVSGSHTGVTSLTLDGEKVFEASGDSEQVTGLTAFKEWTFDNLIDTVLALDVSELMWLLEGAKACMSLSNSGGADEAKEFSVKDSLVSEAAARTSKAVEIRMSGRPWPVLTSAGSGNQGIMISIPVLLVSEKQGLTDEKKARALAVAHGVNMLIKAFTGEVSALCGGISAGAGVAAAVCWIHGGGKTQIANAVDRAIASTCGMICDGAKFTCALKGSLSVVSGIEAGLAASGGLDQVGNQGIVGLNVDETLARLGSMSSEVFSSTDALLLELAGVEKV